MMQTYSPATEKEAVAVTSVWWDINRCPVPDDVDARLIGPFIRESLMKLGYSGPLTITAIGKLTEVDTRTLLDLCCTGVALYHAPTEALVSSFWLWLMKNPPPANFMVISREGFYDGYLETISPRYNILGSIDPKRPKSIYTCFARSVGCYLWESLLASIKASVAAHLIRESSTGSCSGRGASAFFCKSCNLDFCGFDVFTCHLGSKEHALKDLYYCPGGGRKAAHESLGMDVDAIRGVLKRLRETPRKRGGEEEEEEEEEKKN